MKCNNDAPEKNSAMLEYDKVLLYPGTAIHNQTNIQMSPEPHDSQLDYGMHEEPTATWQTAAAGSSCTCHQVFMGI